MINKYIFLLIFLSSAISYAQISKSDGTLPVELIYFYAESYPDSILLKWGTATELANYGFNLERSTNVPDWEIIGFVFGHGTSYVTNHYTFGDTTTVPNTIYYYRLHQIDNDGNSKYSDTIAVNYLLSIKQLSVFMVEDFTISQNYPNPFNPSTNIEVSLPKSGELSLRVFDLLGNRVYEKNYGEQFAGKYQLTINAKSWSSGIYIYNVQSGKFSSSKSMILLK